MGRELSPKPLQMDALLLAIPRKLNCAGNRGLATATHPIGQTVTPFKRDSV